MVKAELQAVRFQSRSGLIILLFGKRISWLSYAKKCQLFLEFWCFGYNNAGRADLNVYNMLGEVVYSSSDAAFAGENNFVVDALTRI